MAPQLPQRGSSTIGSVSIGRPIRAVGDRINVEAYSDGAGVQSQSSVISIANATNSSEYSIRFLSTAAGVDTDETVSYTTEGSTSQVALRDGLIAAIEASPALGYLIAGIEAGTNEIAVTGAADRSFAVSFPANPSTHLTAATTAAGFTQYLYGRAVECYEIASILAGKAIRKPSVGSGGALVLTLDVNTTAQTSTTTVLVTHADGSVETKVLTVTSSTTATATTAAILAAAQIAFPTAVSAITTADSEVTVTFPTGDQVAILSGPVNSSTLDITAATTDGSASPLRLVVDDYSTAPLETRGTMSQALGPVPGQAINGAAPSGSTIWEADGSSRALSSTRVYVDANGVLYDAAAAGRRLWVEARWLGQLEANRNALEL